MAPLFQFLRVVYWRDDRGQDLVEYALIIFLVILGVALVLPSLADTLIGLYYNRVIVALGG